MKPSNFILSNLNFLDLPDYVFVCKSGFMDLKNRNYLIIIFGMNFAVFVNKNGDEWYQIFYLN